MSDFRVYSTNGQIDGVAFYFIESTAPESVDQPLQEAVAPPDGLTSVDPDRAVSDIVKVLITRATPETDARHDNSEVEDANLVVMVHGFNNPRDRVLDFYDRAVSALNDDKNVIFREGRRIVFIGYRWPSESIGCVLRSSLRALPLFPLWALGIAGIVVAAFSVGLFAEEQGWTGPPIWVVYFASALALASISLIAMTVMVVLLRAIVYFRDVYRATNNGVPDLVEVIRQIDREASDTVDRLWNGDKRPRKRIALSFIGHSMGGLVVTNVIRVLSDVFDKDVIRTTLAGRRRPGPASDRLDGMDRVSAKIGHVFTLMRFVLASPDIPAETLLAGRANFLASSLRRFREAYLFSNEGDEVLRLISTTANYFSFPTKRRKFGYRLGNAEILASEFGQASNPRQMSDRDFLGLLRVGSKTLANLSNNTVAKDHDPAEVAAAFTYFDCTDCVDGPRRNGILTEARNYKARGPLRRIPYYAHMVLLLRYLLNGSWHINVHGGYFDGAVTQRLIYRLACLGFEGAGSAYQEEATTIPRKCSEHQIRVMLSRRLKHSQPLEYMETPAMTGSVTLHIVPS